MSTKRELDRHFRKYITYNQDNFQLLFHILQKLVQDAANYLHVRDGIEAPEQVEIEEDDFATRVREFILCLEWWFFS